MPMGFYVIHQLKVVYNYQVEEIIYGSQKFLLKKMQKICCANPNSLFLSRASRTLLVGNSD